MNNASDSYMQIVTAAELELAYSTDEQDQDELAMVNNEILVGYTFGG